jgi:hypothetical protein
MIDEHSPFLNQERGVVNFKHDRIIFLDDQDSIIPHKQQGL